MVWALFSSSSSSLFPFSVDGYGDAETRGERKGKGKGTGRGKGKGGSNITSQPPSVGNVLGDQGGGQPLGWELDSMIKGSSKNT